MSLDQIPPKTTGLTRIYKAFFYSVAGFKAAYRSENAFRQELLFLLFSTGAAWLLALPLNWSLWLTFGAVFILMMELANTAVERIIDLVSPEFHQLAKEAKDIGSAMVLLSLLFYGLLWCLALWMKFQILLP